MSGFFGIIMSSLQTTLLRNTVSAGRSATTSSISATASNTSGGSLSYSWQTTGNSCVINTPSSSSTTVTGGGVAGTSELKCNITNSLSRTTYPSPICVITWNPATEINSVTWSIPSNRNSSYNGTAQSVTVSSIDPTGTTYSLATTTATNADSIAFTILTGTGDYNGTFRSPNLTIGAATLTASSTISYTTYNGANQTLSVLSGINGTYSGSTTASGINAGSYTTTITGTGNYTGNVTGILFINQEFGIIDIFYGGVYDAGYTNTVIVPIRIANASYEITTSVSGPGAADAWVSGNYVTNTNVVTKGFVVTITATITDPNYTANSASTSVTFNAYVPSSGGGGGPYEGGGGGTSY